MNEEEFNNFNKISNKDEILHKEVENIFNIRDK